MSSDFRRFVVRFLAVSTLMMCLGLSVHAQSDIFGAISGTVLDQTNKSIPGASVTVTNVATNAAAPAVKTDSNGRFLISNLAPGVYSVEVAAASFANYKQDKVIVEVGRTTPLDIQVGVAGKVETVNVSAEAPVVDTESNDFAANMNKTSIDNLPLNIRRWSQFALLTPGAVPDGTFGDVSFRGISGLLNNVTVDGADDNQAYFAEEKGRTRIAYSTSANAVQEFQVNTSDYSAEYGRSAGGVVNAITKSGSNTLHGTAMYYNRDNAWAAFNPFATAAKQTSPGVFTVLPIKPTDERQQFGGDLGGWLIKNKLFWYFNFDDQLHRFPGIALPTNPTFFFTGITVAAPPANPVTAGNPTGSGCLISDAGQPDDGKPVASFRKPGSSAPEGQQMFCRGISQAQVNSAFTFLDSLTGTVPRTGNQQIYFPKLEYKLSTNNDITASFNRMRWRSPFGIQTSTVVSRGIDSFGDDFVKADTGIVRWTWNHGSSLTNEARFNYGRDFEFEFTDPPAPGEPVASTGLSPQIDINGSTSFTFGAPNFLQRAALPDEHRYQGSDTVGWNHGKHFFKFGFDVNRVNDRINNLFQGLGEYSYNNRDDFISDYAALVNHINGGSTCFTQNAATATNANIPCYNTFTQGFGISGLNFNTWDTAVFVQDDFHVTRKLTLDLGLRWEHEAFPAAVTPNALVPLTGHLPSDNKDYGPRVGFAWDIFGTGKTVVRGGGGIYYGRIINGNIFNSLVNTGVASGSQISATFQSTTGSGQTGTPNAGAPLYPNIVPSFSPAASSNIVFFAGDARMPQIDQFDLVVEHEISPNTVISLSYIGTLGRFLPLAQDINLPAATTQTYTIAGTVPVNFLKGPALPVAGTTFVVPAFYGPRPNASFGQMSQISTIVQSRYNAAVLQFTRRMTHGVQVQSSYTYSHALDDDQVSSATLSGNTPQNPQNVRGDYSNSNFNVPHKFVTSLIWQPERYAKSDNVAAKWILSGWTLSPIFVMSSGLPVSASVSGNLPSSGAPSPATFTGVIGAGGSTRVPFFARNSFTLPRFINADIRLARDFHIWERASLQISVDFFNLFNHVNVTSVGTTLFTSVSGTFSTATLNYPNVGSSTFSVKSNGNNGTFSPTPRLMQIGGRISF
jgi:hypothetical protein